MRKQLLLSPDGWPCTLSDCPPGPFLWLDGEADGALGFMSEYRDQHGPQAFNEAGERIPLAQHGSAKVQPLQPVWTETED